MIKTVTKVIILCSLFSLAFGQTLTLSPYGVSPRGAAADAEDIFDVAYNGLLNVGVETKMYLKAEFVDSAFSGLVWSVTSAPASSGAAFGAPVAVGTDVEIAAFTPDLVGKYVLTVTEGATTISIVVNAGTYLGYEGGNTTCAQCHQIETAGWLGTGHSDMLVRAFNGTLSDHYGSYCVNCHVVGYDTNADNDGFDDFGFVYPDSTAIAAYGHLDGHFFEGLYDSLAADYPDAFMRANIQCESCHGPGSAHLGNTADSKMVASLDAKNCAWCHDSGTHHAFPDQWEASVHAALPTRARGASAGCAPCHSGSGFIAWVEGGMVPLTSAPPVVPITCATCHDPHSAENEHQLRVLEPVTLGDGTVIDNGGNGQLCMNCHKGRRDPSYYNRIQYSSHFGPHYSCQADMLAGANVPTFGKKLPSSPHLGGTPDACVSCHMAGELADASGNIIHVGGHSWNMVDPVTGADHVESCTACHGEVGESFDEKKYFFNGKGDHDGDGVVEGLQEEVHGLLEELAVLLPPVGVDEVDIGGTYEYTLTEVQAAFNYFFVEEDRSFGIHNPAFTVALLKVSINALMDGNIAGDIVAIEDVPNDQGYQVRIVWDNLVDEITVYDPVIAYIVKRFDDFGDEPGWTNVGEVTPDGSARYALEVETVYNNVGIDTAWTEFKIVALTQSGVAVETVPGAGFSEDNLVPEAPVNLLASVTDNNVQITWDASVAPDVKYYKIYRGGVEIATTIDLSFTDTGLSQGDYTYEIAAVDFSANEGDAAAINATILGVEAGSLPLAYKLSQNYPNPFNPVTTINFTLKKAGLVNLTVYNSVGQVVRELLNREMDYGSHSINFSAENLPSGIYFYTISTDDFTQTKKMVLLK